MNNALAIALLLIDGALLYALVRRYAGFGWAIGVAAVFALNPATIDSALTWGPMPFVGCALALIGLYGLVRCAQVPDKLSLVWLAVAIAGLFGVAWILVSAFVNAPPWDSYDAYNLWTIKNAPQTFDSQTILIFPQIVWGLGLFLAAMALLIARNFNTKGTRTLVESGALLALAFCLLPTRSYQHDMVYALAMLGAAMPLARRYVVAYVVLSFSFLVGIVHAQDLPAQWTILQHGLSLINVGVFFTLGYIFLGQEGADEAAFGPVAARASAAPAAKRSPAPKPVVESGAPPIPSSRSWFDPTEGVAYMRPLDYVVGIGISFASFCVMFYHYWFPTDKIFDEIYFARAAEEYLTRQYIYENTHPPVTKLLITLSTMLHGGMAHGDNSGGWRWLGVVFAALTVLMLYALAKRITRSTLFSAYTAGLLAFDGMHFVQARIATPETYVAFFATATVYTFYRFWLASQVRIERRDPTSTVSFRVIGIAASIVLAGAVTMLFWHQIVPQPSTSQLTFDMDVASFAAVMLYFAAGLYLVYRLLVEPRIVSDAPIFASFPDGSRFDGSTQTMFTSDGSVLDKKSKPRTLSQGELRVTYGGDGSVQYDSPDGSARYDTATKPQNSLLWLFLFSLSIGLLVGSKWYGVMAYGVAFVVVLGVWSQRYWDIFVGRKRPAVWGNPFGFRLDVVAAVVVFITMSIYWAAYIPSFHGLSDQPGSVPRPYTINDVVTMQYNAYEYHKNLVATHPYASKWYQWPIDYKPLLYYAKYGGTGKNSTAGMIYSLPNPFIMWMGLLSVPWIGVLAFKQRNKGYALLVITYLAQWLPWAGSPRIAFLYHFYVNIPVICLCNALLAQQLWKWADARGRETRLYAGIAIGAYFLAVGLLFWYFWPILTGTPIPTDAWMQRMWYKGWI